MDVKLISIYKQFLTYFNQYTCYLIHNIGAAGIERKPKHQLPERLKPIKISWQLSALLRQIHGKKHRRKQTARRP
jgi:hypothetical protein